MPYPYEHSCRIRDPKEFTSFARKNDEQEHESKPIAVIYGIKRGKTHIQALRYSTSAWSEPDAAEHCRSRKGDFRPARTIKIVQPTRQNWNLPLARDDEVRIVEKMVDFGNGPETIRVFEPKNKLITKEQRERAERDYEAAHQWRQQ